MQCPECGNEMSVLVERIASKCKKCGHVESPAEGAFFNHAIAMAPLLSEATLDGLRTEFDSELRRRQVARQKQEEEQQRAEAERMARIMMLPFAQQRNYTQTVGRVALDVNTIYVIFGDKHPVEIPYATSMLLEQLGMNDLKEFESQAVRIVKPTFDSENPYRTMPEAWIYLRGGYKLDDADLMVVGLNELIGAAYSALKV